VSPLYAIRSLQYVFPLPLLAPVTHSSPLHHAIGSLLANNDAISDMVSGLPLHRLDFNEINMNIETTILAITQDNTNTNNNNSLV
jgi:hypothetical protein